MGALKKKKKAVSEGNERVCTSGVRCGGSYMFL